MSDDIIETYDRLRTCLEELVGFMRRWRGSVGNEQWQAEEAQAMSKWLDELCEVMLRPIGPREQTLPELEPDGLAAQIMEIPPFGLHLQTVFIHHNPDSVRAFIQATLPRYEQVLAQLPARRLGCNRPATGMAPTPQTDHTDLQPRDVEKQPHSIAKDGPPPPPPETANPPTKIDLAIVKVKEHPEWTDAKIADEVGCTQPNLTQCPRYKLWAKASRAEAQKPTSEITRGQYDARQDAYDATDPRGNSFVNEVDQRLDDE